jgi:hypothetical protein
VLTDGELVIGFQQLQETFGLSNYATDFMYILERLGKNEIQFGIAI